MKTQTLETQILSFVQAVHQQDLPETAADYAEARELSDVFSAGVDFLAKLFPNPVINRLMRSVWDTVGQKVVPVCFGMRVTGLSFIRESFASQPFIATPVNWVRMVRLDPITQVGALVFVGSQAVDYAHDRIQEPSDRVPAVSRARAYESEYLMTVQRLTPAWEPNRYQEALLKEFPEGIATPKARSILYSIRPLVVA
jgi:hypothetical protein